MTLTAAGPLDAGHQTPSRAPAVQPLDTRRPA